MATRFMQDEEGGEVLDTTTGLIWQRCSLGQTWNGETCVGEAKEMSYDEAMEYAENQEGWRMPTIEELERLIDRRLHPAISANAFPGTYPGWYWSSSLYAVDSSYAWYVDFYDGGVSSYGRYLRNAVRLVKTGEEK